MRALIFTGERGLRLIDRPLPDIPPGWVRVRVARASICGTDLHKHVLPAEDHLLADGSPCTVGHEPAGTIAAVGDGVDPARIGERVVVAGVIGCGQCAPCRSGYNTACQRGPSGLHWNRHGCDADFLVFPAANAIRLPEAVSFDTAAVLACAGGTALTSLREAGVQPGMHVAVVGLGPVGLCTVILARALGNAVVGIDPDPARRLLADSLGCAATATPEAADSLRAQAGDAGFGVVVEAVGRAAAQRLAIDLVGPGGAVALAGLGKESITIDLTRALIGRSGARLVGIAATPIRYFDELVWLAARGLPFDRLVSHRFPLEQAAEAFATAASGRCCKVLLTIDN